MAESKDLYRHPFIIWHANKDSPKRVSDGIADACHSFVKAVEELKREHGLKPMEERRGTLVYHYFEADPQRRYKLFQRVYSNFVASFCDVWIEFIVAWQGKRGKKAIEILRSKASEFSSILVEHNWTWGLMELKAGPEVPGSGTNLTESAILDKVSELERIFADNKRPRRKEDNLEFHERAAWLRLRLRERAWNRNDPRRHGGPDAKTIDKILAGQPVSEEVLEKLARALSTKFGKVELLAIPQA